MIKITPNAYSSVFVLPTDVADNHIRLAGSVQLKVLIWIFRHSSENITAQDISDALGLDCADVKDAMQYWIEAGFITDETDSTERNEKGVLQSSQSNKIRKIQPQTGFVPVQNEDASDEEKIAPVRPTHEQVAARISESEDVRNLFFEVERILGRTLGHDTQSSILFLMDYEGLPAEVIVMLCEYASSIGKKNIRYIEKMGQSWAKKDIDTFEKASEYVKKLENADSLWNEIRIITGLENPKPTSRQSEYLLKWSTEYGFSVEIICYSYERMIEKTGRISFAYMDKMLAGWHSQNLKNISDIEKYESEYIQSIKEKKDSVKKSTASKQEYSKPSYDINKAFGGFSVPKKTKKGQ